MTNKTFAASLSLAAILALSAFSANPAEARTRQQRPHHRHAASLAHVVAAQPSLGQSVDRSGAMGLMQIKTQTARGEGFSGGPAGLLNPETNVRFAMRYLATAYRMSGGDLCGTVMRYQSGHGARHMSAADRSYCAKARSLMASN